MKTLFVAALALMSLNAFAKVEIGNLIEKREFDQYVISSDKAGSITLNVDVKTVKVDCHGLDEKYSKDILSTGEILITKQPLFHTMQMCRVGTDRVATTGVSFKVSFKEDFGGSVRVMVPAGADISVKK